MVGVFSEGRVTDSCIVVSVLVAKSIVKKAKECDSTRETETETETKQKTGAEAETR